MSGALGGFTSLPSLFRRSRTGCRTTDLLFGESYLYLGAHMRTAATLRLVFSMLVAAVLALLLPVAAPSPVGAAGLTAGAQPVENPITVENRHQGNRSWQIPWAGYTVADDTTMAVKGYASAT